MRRVLRFLLAGVLLPGLVLGGTLLLLDRPLPEATPGPEAEALADALLEAVDAEAWAATGAVTWRLGPGGVHTWDRERHLDRVVWGDTVVLVDLTSRTGRAWVGEEEVHGRRASSLVEDAHAAWVNDAFWLNPVVKLRDPGVRRGVVESPEGTGLLVQYSSGGLTPGDAYLWLPGPDGRPAGWRMWVSVVPFGGAWTSWQGWTRLQTGAWVATVHDFGPFAMHVTGLQAAPNLAELEPGPDPFAPLLGSASEADHR